ncbi:hypothetical protein [Arthrobacter mobilis]|uniref:Uncharacterized protein n=1 Tax=Arthrobacter mobilis TaxID=2724944 RepID=A0A7X6HBQ6_9MICC|nr:hypothetical protein [Arthrobacter mobilis]NKX52956.1 hypothetical protein [Arthrobacter mobilis]
MNTFPPAVPSSGPADAARPRGPFLAVSIQDYEVLASAREAFVDFLLAPSPGSAALQPRRDGTGG